MYYAEGQEPEANLLHVKVSESDTHTSPHTWEGGRALSQRNSRALSNLCVVGILKSTAHSMNAHTKQAEFDNYMYAVHFTDIPYVLGKRGKTRSGDRIGLWFD